MATRKIFFVLSLALLINPALHCMEDMENKDTENSNNIGVVLAVGLSLVMLSCEAKICYEKKVLLSGSQNTNVATGKKSTGICDCFQTTGTFLDFYAIFRGSNQNMFSMLHKKVCESLFPRRFELLTGKREYNLNDNDKIRKSILRCMQTMHLNGIVALMTPLDGEQKRKTLIVKSDVSYNVFKIVGTDVINLGTEIPTSEHPTIDHLVLVRRISQTELQKTLNLNTIPLNSLSAVKQYHKDIIGKIFSNNNDSNLKEDRAALLISPSCSKYTVHQKKTFFGQWFR